MNHRLCLRVVSLTICLGKVVAAMVEQRKPLLLFTALPGDGHRSPLLQMTDGLIRKGYQVAFVASPEYKDKIVRLNAEYVPTLGPFDLVSKSLVERQFVAKLVFPIGCSPSSRLDSQ